MSTYKVTAGELGPIRLNEAETVASVLQNIAIILQTRQGTVPMYRGFGLPLNFLDKPIPAAKPMLYAEVKEAIEEYEPRAKVVGVTFQEDAAFPGRLIPTVEVEIIDE